jgi:hypothetical protein
MMFDSSLPPVVCRMVSALMSWNIFLWNKR